MLICETCLKRDFITDGLFLGGIIAGVCKVCKTSTYCYNLPQHALKPIKKEIITYDAFFQINDGEPKKFKENILNGKIEFSIAPGTNQTLNFQDEIGNTFKIFIKENKQIK